MKGKALRRAIVSADALRINTSVPLIVDTTELVTPDTAKAWLQHNQSNRPVNWHRVDAYAGLMVAGKWRLHGQGIMFDTANHLLTGQNRLWAVIKAGVNVYLRVSRGNPIETAPLIDRGVPQSARDLAARETGRFHAPTEASIARALLVLDGQLRPTVDELAAIVTRYAPPLAIVLAGTRGTRKTREVLMIAAALIHRYGAEVQATLTTLPILVDKLRMALLPRTATECWGHGAAFSLAMEQARRLVSAIV